MQARLDAFENDNDAGETIAVESDDEVVLHDDDEGTWVGTSLFPYNHS